MICYFLRHGPAGDPAQWSGRDFDRPLTDDGRKRIMREAKTLAELSIELDAIVTSPLVRARQTAECVADELKLGNKMFEDRRVGPGFSPELLAEILEERRDADAVMLVGHEPSMSEVVSHIIGDARIQFKKGTVACVELSDPQSLIGELVWLASPNLLTRRKS
jgi:phosphohistidine phosphatase